MIASGRYCPIHRYDFRQAQPQADIRHFTFISLGVALTLATTAGCDSSPADVSIGVPALQSPEDLATFQTRSFVEFSWRPVQGAGSYQIAFEYEDYPEFDTVVTTIVPLTVQQLEDIGNIRWRVRAISSGGNGAWSARRTLESLPSIVQGSLQFAPEFSTAGIEVGETVSLSSGVPFSVTLLDRLVSVNASQRTVRDIIITEFRVGVTKPAGTVLDQFSNWRVTAGPPQSLQTVLAIPEPAPATASIVATDFVRPEDWISVALDQASLIGIAADVNPRTPKETDVGWSLALDFTMLLNH